MPILYMMEMVPRHTRPDMVGGTVRPISNTNMAGRPRHISHILLGTCEPGKNWVFMKT